MAAGCCFLWCMRYNPSQASRLLLDPLISDDSAKFQTDFGGFVHSGSGKSPLPAPERFTGHAPSLFVSGSPHYSRQPSLPPHCLTTKQSNVKFELGHKSNLNQQSVPPQDDR